MTPSREKSALYSALIRGQREEFARILEQYPALTSEMRDGDWLYYAVAKGSPAFIDDLLHRGCDVNATKDGELALASAIRRGSLDVVAHLLARGADVTLESDHDRFAISAVIADQDQIPRLKLLAANGVDLARAFPDRIRGGTINALDIAEDRGMGEVVRFLKDHGVRSARHKERSEHPCAIRAYFEGKFGPAIETPVREAAPTSDVSMAFYVIPPNKKCSDYTVFSSGLSKHELKAPAGSERFRRAEIFFQLPATWRIDRITRKSEWGWPFVWAHRAAAHAVGKGRWLGGAFGVFRESPPKPLGANCPFTAFLLLAEHWIGEGDDSICLYRGFGVFPEELTLEKRSGIGSLLTAFDSRNVGFVNDGSRVNVGKT